MSATKQKQLIGIRSTDHRCQQKSIKYTTVTKLRGKNTFKNKTCSQIIKKANKNNSTSVLMVKIGEINY